MLIVDHQRVGQLVQAGAMPQDGEGILGKVESRGDQEEEMTIPCLIVISGKERYAFELSGIIEIIEAGICTPIPGAPDYLKGFHLVRDQALPVIDLLTLMQQPEIEKQKSWVIIIERDNVRYGLLVNVIEGIEHFPLDSYEPIVDSDSNLSGLFVYQEKTTILLSPKRIVDEEKFQILSHHADFHTENNVQSVEETERYLQVSICDNRYAIPIDHVKRVAQFFPMEEISDANDSIRGAIDIDGSIIPVLALEKALSLQNLVDQGEYVIVSNGAVNNNTSSNSQQEWAICVDAAQGLVDIPSSHIKRMPHGNSHFVNGVAHLDETLISLLNFSQLEFSIQENSQ
jgi:chemotaxis signal transduction protein